MTRRNLFLTLPGMGILGIARASHTKPTSDTRTDDVRKLQITLDKETFEALDAMSIPINPIGHCKRVLIEDMIFDRSRGILSWIGPGGLTELQTQLINAYDHLQPSLAGIAPIRNPQALPGYNHLKTR